MRVLPLLDGLDYAGPVTRELIPDAVADDERVPGYAADLPVRTAASTPLEDALLQLDEARGTRLVVLEEDGRTYARLVCLRSDRDLICADAGRLALPV